MTSMTAVDGRVALAGVEIALRSLALSEELDGRPERADQFTRQAQLVQDAREAWERERTGFE